MWIPENVAELEQAIRSGSAAETHNLEFKRELPPSGSKGNRKLAREVAGLAVDGGTLIYGVDEDEAGRPTILVPFELAGAQERVGQIVRSSIEEPPFVKVVPLWKDKTAGYLVVVVPASPRAPHQVTAGGENVYYGRSGTRTVPLEEGAVARLYRLRTERAEERRTFIDATILELPRRPERPAMYVAVLPLGDVSVDREHLRSILPNILNETREQTRNESPPSFLQRDFLPRTDGIRVNMAERGQWDQKLDVTMNGVVRFMSEGAVGYDRDGQPWILPDGLGVKTHQVCRVAGEVLKAAEFFGSTVVAFALIGAEGVPTDIPSMHREPHPFDLDDYREIRQVASQRLLDEPERVAEEITENLFHALRVPERRNPFR